MQTYTPSNGSESTQFIEDWCENCINFPVCTAFKSRAEYNKKRRGRKKDDPNQLNLF